ncbi:hypothetical protein [Vibrio phage J14]|nr:hypothetical protein [Vibrio phage J14]
MEQRGITLMATKSENIIQKADMTLQDLIDNGGYLSTAQSALSKT